MKIHTYMKSAFAIVGALVVLNGFAAEKKVVEEGLALTIQLNDTGTAVW